MSGELFGGGLPRTPPPRSGNLYGPYARQVVSGRLKFWFALVTEHGEVRRYEVVFEKGSRRGSARYRAYAEGNPPQYGANFEAYRVPDDLSRFPAVPYVKGALIKDTARALLTGEDAADVLRLALTGEPPRKDAPDGDAHDPRAVRSVE
jgi:hypothetical protein